MKLRRKKSSNKSLKAKKGRNKQDEEIYATTLDRQTDRQTERQRRGV
jgi:hypothetical protein